jgi:hypothetical protein
MKLKLLLPRYFKIIGGLMVIPGVIMGLIFQYKNNHFPYYHDSLVKTINLFPSAGLNTFNDEIIITLLVVGLFFIGFSKVKNENESIIRLRLSTLNWSILTYSAALSVFLILYYVVLLFKIQIPIWNDPMLDINSYNLFMPLLVFTIRFYYMVAIHKNKDLVQGDLLLPFKPFKLIGKITTTLLLILISFSFVNKWVENFAFSGVLCLLPTALFLWIASKQKDGNKTTLAVRLKAMQIACCVNYILLITLTWLVYSLGFLAVLYANLVSLSFIFLAVFYWMLAREKRKISPINLNANPIS